MFLVIPEIYMAQGKCQVNIEAGDRSDGYYESLSDSPEKLARLFRRENAKSLMITIDDISSGKQFQAVKSIVSSSEIPLQLNYLSTKISQIETEKISDLFELGLHRLILSSTSWDKIAAKNYLSDYQPSIFPMLDYSKIDTHKEYQADRIYCSISQNKWNKEVLEKLLTVFSPKRITLYGGISNFAELKLASSFINEKIDSCVIGKPLYDNCFPCQAIWRDIESEIDSGDFETPISSVKS